MRLHRVLPVLVLMVSACPARQLDAADQAYDVWVPVALEFADYLAIGRIVATEPHSDDVPERVSLLVVDETFTPNAAVGDTLAVLWAANVWHPTADSTVFVACATAPQLTALEQRSMLWILELKTGTKEIHEFAMAVEPYELSREGLEALKGVIHLSETPTSDEAEQIDRRRAEVMEYLQVRPSDLESYLVRRRAVVERLKQVVAKLEEPAGGD